MVQVAAVHDVFSDDRIPPRRLWLLQIRIPRGAALTDIEPVVPDIRMKQLVHDPVHVGPEDARSGGQVMLVTLRKDVGHGRKLVLVGGMLTELGIVVAIHRTPVTVLTPHDIADVAQMAGLLLVQEGNAGEFILAGRICSRHPISARRSTLALPELKTFIPPDSRLLAELRVGVSCHSGNAHIGLNRPGFAGGRFV